MAAPADTGVDVTFMRAALAHAVAARGRGEVPVGAVLVRGEEILAGAGNSPIATHDPTAHAEVQVLRAAGRALSSYRLADTTLYVTLEPCVMCAAAMVHARVRRLVFGAWDPRRRRRQYHGCLRAAGTEPPRGRLRRRTHGRVRTAAAGVLRATSRLRAALARRGGYLMAGDVLAAGGVRALTGTTGGVAAAGVAAAGAVDAGATSVAPPLSPGCHSSSVR